MRRSLCAIVLVLLSGAAHAEQAPPSGCNEFSQSVCFTIGDGDTRTHKLIIDFTIDEVQFGKDAHITIYQGIGLAEQDDVGTVTTPLSYKTESGKVDVKAGSRLSPRYFDIHYTPATGWGTVQVFAYVKDAKQAAALSDFMSGIHPCKTENASVTCSRDAPFDQAAKFVRGLVQ